MTKFLTFPAGKHVLLYSAALVMTGAVLGAIVASAVLMNRLKESETITHSLQDFAFLQSNRIASLSVVNVSSVGSVAGAGTLTGAQNVQPISAIPTFPVQVATATLALPVVAVASAAPAATSPVAPATIAAAAAAASASASASASAPALDPAPVATVAPAAAVAVGSQEKVAPPIQAPPPVQVIAKAAKAIQKPSKPEKPVILAKKPAPVVAVAAPPAKPVKTDTLVNNTNNSKAVTVVAAAPTPTPTATNPAAGASTVTFEQAGITGIDSSSIRFKSGRLVSVGGEFPSGEKLISVNPSDGRIVTDRRVILVAKPQLSPAQPLQNVQVITPEKTEKSEK